MWSSQASPAIAWALSPGHPLVRTCCGHIAKRSAALGSGSRTQLGDLIARSGILDDRTADPAD